MITRANNSKSDDSCHCELTPQEIIITAGGLSEPIDNVRVITNKSTGTLGALIAEEALNHGHIVHYVHSGSSKMPSDFADKFGANLYLYEVNTARELLDLLQSDEFRSVGRRVSKFVHAMAVSDFEVAKIEPPLIGGKISSDTPEIQITLKPTPKVIGYLHDLFPDAIIFGFKLLSGVEVSELLDAAYALGEKNNCDYVVANRLEDISADKHIAHIIRIDERENPEKCTNAIEMCQTKREIAEFIVDVR